MVISGYMVDVLRRNIFKGRIFVENGTIVDIMPAEDVNNIYIVPGLIDAHIHIESSMITPGRFAQNAVRFGVVATVSDPHEIANVCGIEGVEFMIKNAQKVPFKFYFGVPSCVPATPFESSGAVLSPEDIAYLFDEYGLKYLAEMMNFPGVVNQSPDVMAKLKVAIDRNLPIDGHAPGLTGEPLNEYIKAGVDTDHECTTLAEAEEKISLGMKILIRDGSAAKDFEELYPLIDLYPDHVMICSDDFHPENFSSSYLDRFIRVGKDKGLDFWNVLQAMTVNPISHYKLDVGLLQKGDPADFIVVDDLKRFKILQTWINGELAFDGNNSFDYIPEPINLNNFNASEIISDQIHVPATGSTMNVIQAFDGQLFTEHIICKVEEENGFCVSNLDDDILKLVVLNRYDHNAEPIVGFIKGFNLKNGAIASSVAHDSHNIIAVGVSDDDIVSAINAVVVNKGGLSVAKNNKIELLSLPIAGLISDESVEVVASKYLKLDNLTKQNGSLLKSPFMTLAFMSLLVIPKLKLGDKGLFDVTKFDFVDLCNK
ncbi:MAG: adenine deaminase [Salinivirgaceae bacterium]|nr:adenine deaminase [Salinivirgaceae bacterium]MDD4746051.1 adenine deaminase [Salinivirgaceae bacterium]